MFAPSLRFKIKGLPCLKLPIFIYIFVTDINIYEINTIKILYLDCVVI